MMKRTFASLGLGLMLAAAPLVAHHSFSAQYDSKKPVKLRGVVTKVEWMNPHAYFYLNVPEDNGKLSNWAFEMGAPSGLQRQGWNRNTLHVGDEVIVEGSRAKDGSNLVNAKNVFLAKTGQRLGAASSEGGEGDR
jgi:hypothetical protein